MRMAHRCLAGLLAAFCFVFALSSALAQTPSPADRAAAVYQEGKTLYDAGDFRGARSKFIDAIKLEPGKARWHYNLGLAHRQLENFPAAREALLKARQLDPDYKREEISAKLASMGFDPAGSDADRPVPSIASGKHDDTSPDIWMFAGMAVLAAGFVAFVVKRIRRSKRAIGGGKKSPSREPPPDAAAVAAIGRRLDTAAPRLVQVEHSLRLAEHPDLRWQLDHATQLEQGLRLELAAAKAGDAGAFRKAGRAIAAFEDSATRAAALAQQAFGAPAFAAHGERIACYFCARPLANPDYRQLVALKRGDSRDEVVSCPNCAKASAQGQAPSILVSADGKTHWSEIADFDPYAARHAAADGLQRLPAWRFAPQRSVGELALLAGGAALAGGAIAALLRSGQAQADEPLLDLDAAQESGLAQEAARAAARSARAQRGERSDHS